MTRALLFCFVLLCACKKPEEQKKTETPPPPPAIDRTIVVKKMFEAFNKHDWEAMAACYTDPADIMDPSLGQTYVKQTRQQTIAKYKALQQSAPDLNDKVVAMYTYEDKVVVEFVASGTSGGQKWNLPICTIFTVDSNIITKDATYYDQ